MTVNHQLKSHDCDSPSCNILYEMYKISSLGVKLKSVVISRKLNPNTFLRNLKPHKLCSHFPFIFFLYYQQILSTSSSGIGHASVEWSRSTSVLEDNRSPSLKKKLSGEIVLRTSSTQTEKSLRSVLLFHSQFLNVLLEDMTWKHCNTILRLLAFWCHLLLWINSGLFWTYSWLTVGTITTVLIYNTPIFIYNTPQWKYRRVQDCDLSCGWNTVWV